VALVYAIVSKICHYALTSTAAQYNAWCRRNGDHYTKLRGAVNWNQDLIWKMKSELELQWELVEEEVTRVLDELLEDLKTKVTDLQTSLEGMCPYFHIRLTLNQEWGNHQSA
jgi:hypothetical protein